VTLDVTDPAQIRTAAEQIGSPDILINNAGVQPFDDLSDIVPIEQAPAVNPLGTYRVIRGFLPTLTRSREPSSTICRCSRGRVGPAGARSACRRLDGSATGETSQSGTV